MKTLLLACTAFLLSIFAPSVGRAALVAPTLNTATGDYKWVDLHWTDNSSGADGFVIQYSLDGTTFANLIRLPLSFGVDYSAYVGATQTTYFRVADYQGATTGPWSNVLSAATNATADVRADLLTQFHLTDGANVFNYNNPKSLTTYTDAQKSSQRSATLSMKTALLSAATSTTSPHSYTIPAGVYRVAPNDFMLNGVQNFTINAPGVTFIIDSTANGYVFAFVSCANLTVQGPLVWDAENLLYSEGKITAYDTSTGLVTVAIAPGYSTTPRPAYAFVTFDGNGVEHVQYSYSSYTAVNASTLQFQTAATGTGYPDLNPGNYVMIRETGPNQRPFATAACTNVAYVNITNYSGFQITDTNSPQGYTNLINWLQIPQPGTNRIFGGDPGQFVKSAGGSYLFQGCAFVGGVDDGIDLLNTTGMVDAVLNDTTLVSNLITPQAGDVVLFYDFGTYQYLGTATVASATSVTGSAATSYNGQANTWLASQGDNQVGLNPYQVVFTSSLSFLSGHTWAQMFDQRLQADSIVVKDCYWRGMYAQACLMQAAKHVLVADSLFIGNAGPAMSASASQFWQEGQWPNNIVFRNNVVETSGDMVSPYSPDNSSILVCSDIKKASSARVINNVVIDGNTVVDPNNTGIVAQQAQTVWISRNTVVNPGLLQQNSQTSGIFVNWATTVAIGGNTTLYGTSGFTGAGVQLGTDTVNVAQSGNSAYAGIVNLAGVFNMVGIQIDGATFTTGYGSNSALSGQLLGRTVFWNGGVYSLGAPGTSNVLQPTGQTITLPAGQYSSLTFLGTGTHGDQLSQVFVVHYTDGTSQNFTQSLSDWWGGSNYAGETRVQLMPYYDLNTGVTQAQNVSLFGYAFALNPAKTVASITVPNNTNLRILAMDLSK